ncbi:hypothetical protein F511_42421 [Dorcoceras hygrometricum]|uniref:Homeobox domain-containing protein n=1 Tax=Dorcoceras hygrometricum TaxID=472368 RepID=A0A2Z6ZZV7_9LAMI|nr:hypothetical protein F511_42421 [Dorcoceras hygrometricum]
MEETDVSSNMKLGLDLRLGLSKYEPKTDNSKKNKRVFFLDLSIPHHPSDLDHHARYSSSSCVDIMQETMKQTRKKGIFSGGCKEDDDMNYSNCCRKKLRLSKDQSTLLEDSFRQHSTLTMAQKQELAEKLNLKPRQVEVWFQNRRARKNISASAAHIGSNDSSGVSPAVVQSNSKRVGHLQNVLFVRENLKSGGCRGRHHRGVQTKQAHHLNGLNS